MRKNGIFCFILCLLGGLAYGSELLFPAETSVLIIGNDISAELALREFNELARKATGKMLTRGSVSDGKRHIFIGRSPEAEKRLGKKILEELRDEESLVTSRGTDLFLVGGGAVGTLYAVYDFFEDNLNYRWYLNHVDGEKIDRKTAIVYLGKETRRKPAFSGFRKDHQNHPGTELFRLRSRDNSVVEYFIKGYQYKYGNRIHGHGFFYFLPPYNPEPKYGWRPKGIKGWFQTHPEYFSLNQSGKRDPNMQLCLSNPATRTALTDAVLLWIAEKGKGVYMIGSNDNHNSRYCWCKGCIALEQKYCSTGGPLWEYILELCSELKKRKMEDVYITTLAYKGPQQTERAPDQTLFPDNFICDAAFLNSDRSLTEIKNEILEDGFVFNRYENLKKWVATTDHVSYWYYGGSNPAEVCSRMAKEIRELHKAGVKSVGACGTGGGYEFGDMTRYIFYRLLRNPYEDEQALLKETLNFKYGPAAEFVRQYIDGLDRARAAQLSKIPYLLGCDSVYDNFTFLSGKDLAHWQTFMDQAERVSSGKHPYDRNVRFARIGLDLFSVLYAHKIRMEAPEYSLDPSFIESRGRAAAMEYGNLFLGKKRNEALEMFYLTANYANLKNDKLPQEISKYPNHKVFRFLPPKRGKFYCPHWSGKWTSESDPDACSGFAIADDIPERMDYSDGLGIEYYDAGERKWLLRPYESSIPRSFFEKDRYKMFRIGKVRIPKKAFLVFGGLWGSPTSVDFMSRCFDPSYVEKEYEIWVSIKAQGAKFFKGDTRKDRIFIEQFFAIDMGMPSGK